MAKDKCDLTNEELIKACNDWVSKLAETGGGAWCLQVPVNFNCDPDMLFVELANRFKELTAQSVQETAVEVVSAEEIFNKNIVWFEKGEVVRHPGLMKLAVLSSMKEYASQFTPQKADAGSMVEQDEFNFISDIQDALFIYMFNNNKKSLGKKDLTPAAKYVFYKIKERLAGYAAASKGVNDDWVRLTDKLPEINKQILVYFKNEVGWHVTSAVFDGEAFWCGTDDHKEYFTFKNVITHWRYLPQPPVK